MSWSNLGLDMFPSDSFSDLHLQYKDKTLVIGRSSSPFGPTLYDLDDEFILEQLLFQEEPGTGARDHGDVNFTGLCNTKVEKTGGVDRAGEGSFDPKAHLVKKMRSKVSSSRKPQLMPRKRTGKKDRHSKIHTAQGLRDRRIRLSVHIARKFFDLQEMLGLDKASKTIEWLLAESQDAIDELSRSNCSQLNMDSTSESAMASETKEAEEEGDEGQDGGGRKKRKVREVPVTCMRRGSRDKARARARERTKEKLMMKKLSLEDSEQFYEKGNPICIGGYLGQPENGKDSVHLGAHEMSPLSIIEKFLGFTSTTSIPGSFPDSGLGNDYYEMIGGVHFLED